MLDLSVIIITWNSEQFIRNCLESVLLSTTKVSTEIIIIDNGSTDNTKNYLEEYRSPEKDIFVQFNNKNLGVAAARNIGLQKSKGRYIWILDDDTIVNGEAFDEMYKFMTSTQDCGICACKMLNSAGYTQDSCRKFPSFKFKSYSAIEAILKKSKLTNSVANWFRSKNEIQLYRDKYNSNTVFRVEYVIGACQLIRRDAFEEVGCLDDKIFYGPEDADFCLRMQKKRWNVYFIPQVSIIHEYQQVTRKNIFSKLSIKHIQGLFYYFRKHLFS